jgi:hypothetical protein
MVRGQSPPQIHGQGGTDDVGGPVHPQPQPTAADQDRHGPVRSSGAAWRCVVQGKARQEKSIGRVPGRIAEAIRLLPPPLLGRPISFEHSRGGRSQPHRAQDAQHRIQQRETPPFAHDRGQHERRLQRARGTCATQQGRRWEKPKGCSNSPLLPPGQAPLPSHIEGKKRERQPLRQGPASPSRDHHLAALMDARSTMGGKQGGGHHERSS